MVGEPIKNRSRRAKTVQMFVGGADINNLSIYYGDVWDVGRGSCGSPVTRIPVSSLHGVRFSNFTAV